MKKSIVAASTILVATLSFGSIADDASVNCDTAKEDIAKLESEQKSSLEHERKRPRSRSWQGRATCRWMWTCPLMWA